MATANMIPQQSQEDYGDLLLGLEDGDLNDFDGLDDFGDDLDEACEQMHRSQRDQAQRDGKLSAALQRADYADHRVPLPDPFFDTSVVPKAGFTSGHGRPVAPPSSAALERVKKMFEEVESQSPSPDHDSIETPNKRRKIDQSDEEEEIPDIPAPDFVMMESKGFVTGKGKAVPPPSKAAVEKAMKIIAAVEDAREEFPDSTPVLPKMSFTTGNGNAVAGPSSQALAAAVKLFGEDRPSPSYENLATPVKFAGFTTGSGAPAPMACEAARKRALAMFGEEESTSTQLPGPSISTPLRSTGFTTGSGAAAPMATEAARRKAMAMFGEDNTGSPSRPTTSMLPPTSTPFRPLVQSTSTPQRPANVAEPSSEFRTPLRTTTNIPVASQTSTLPRTMPMKKPQAIEIKTPAPQRRVGLGRTPSSTKAVTKNKFSTPFKQPGRSLGSPLKPSTSLRTSNAVAGPSGLSRAATPAPAKEALVQVFDLSSKPFDSSTRSLQTEPQDRKNMKDAYLHPQFNPISELKELGL